jgi:hypothetical protein
MVDHIEDLLRDFDAEVGLAPESESLRRGSARSGGERVPSPEKIDVGEVGSPQSRESGNQSGSEASFGRQEVNQSERSRYEIGKSEDVSVAEALKIISDLRKQRIEDAEKMQAIRVENARLVAKMAVLEHTDLKVAELSSRIEQLLQKYLETEQIRSEQAAQISELRQEIIVLKSRVPSHVSFADAG